jgi:hypothetical protein
LRLKSDIVTTQNKPHLLMLTGSGQEYDCAHDRIQQVNSIVFGARCSLVTVNLADTDTGHISLNQQRNQSQIMQMIHSRLHLCPSQFPNIDRPTPASLALWSKTHNHIGILFNSARVHPAAFILSAPRSCTSSSRCLKRISRNPSIISRRVSAEYVDGLAREETR